jgi:hypothetical protein
MKTTLKDRLY